MAIPQEHIIIHCINQCNDNKIIIFIKTKCTTTVLLPKSLSFNEVVTFDIKEFCTKYILWMIDSFTRFIQGKLITNKKADTIIQALTDFL